VKKALWLLLIATLAQVCQAQNYGFILLGDTGAAYATVQLTGPVTLSATSTNYGRFGFSNLPPGKYVITPSLSGYTFTPPSQTVTFSSVNLDFVNFNATAVAVSEVSLLASPPNFALGSVGAAQQLQVVATYSAESLQDVTIGSTYASNNTSVATVSQTGLVTAMGNGTATIVASYGGMASSVSATVNIPGVTYSISGSAGAASVTLTLVGASSATTMASSSGAYSFNNLAAGVYTIIPSLSGYTFDPVSQLAAITNASLTGVNFTASAIPHSVDLTWGAGTIADPVSGQVVAGYNIYRGTVSGGPYMQLNAAPVAELTYIDSAVSPGQTWYYVCSTVDNLGDVSTYSNEAAATIP
jgi:Bacterial Ig-like domain (group 2)